jgi:hypothetical protein
MQTMRGLRFIMRGVPRTGNSENFFWQKATLKIFSLQLVIIQCPPVTLENFFSARRDSENFFLCKKPMEKLFLF